MRLQQTKPPSPWRPCFMGCDGARKWINVETHEHFEILVGRVGDEHYWSRGLVSS